MAKKLTIKTVHPVAKKLYKSGKYKTYAEAVAAAWNNHKPTAAKKTKKAQIKGVKINPVSIGAITGNLKSRLMDSLGKLAARKMFAKGKTEKRAMQKQISELKRKIKYL